MPKPMIDIPLASLRCPQRLCPDDPKRLTRSRRRSAVGETRKLAAILVSDVVGYSRLTGADEDRILARLRTLAQRPDRPDHRGPPRPHRQAHRRRLIIEFRSVVDAVNCAIEVQRAMVERNAGVAPDKRIEFRIGIHLGDVVEESDGDLMGDGVNIAARLEGIAKPGAICLSEDAYRQVKGRLDLAVSDLGPTQLKNIADPVRVYSLEVGSPAQVKAASDTKPSEKPPGSRSRVIGGRVRWAAVAALALILALGAWHFQARRPATGIAGRPSLAVLPFANIAGDEATGRLADGLTEDIITDLSRYRNMDVIARNSTAAYKGKAIDVRQVGKDLNVRYVLEGSVQREGDQIRVTAQLIDAASDAHLWSERWDRPSKEFFAVQSDIADQLGSRLGGSGVIDKAERTAAQRSRPENFSAYELYLAGRERAFAPDSRTATRTPSNCSKKRSRPTQVSPGPGPSCRAPAVFRSFVAARTRRSPMLRRSRPRGAPSRSIRATR